MDRVWITNGSTSIPPVANPLIAACREGFVPDRVHLLDNPGIEHVTAPTVAMLERVVAAHRDGASGGERASSGDADDAADGSDGTGGLDVEVTSLDDERDFEAIVAYLQAAIEAAEDAGAEVAVDVTPGRKFWSIISFRAGLDADVEHVYYAHLGPDEYFGNGYPEVPRPAFELVDFAEVLG